MGRVCGQHKPGPQALVSIFGVGSGGQREVRLEGWASVNLTGSLPSACQQKAIEMLLLCVRGSCLLCVPPVSIRCAGEWPLSQRHTYHKDHRVLAWDPVLEE